MNKFYLILITAIAALVIEGCQGQHETDFTVTGNIENVEDDYLILFFKSSPEGAAETIAIDTLKNGRFDFTAPAETGVQYHVMAYSLGVFPSMSVDFYVEPGAKVKITGNDYLTRNWNVKTSSKEQKIYQSYFDEVAELFKELQLLELQCRKEGRSSDYLNLNKPLHAKIDSIQLKWLKSQKRISEPWMDLMLQSVKAAIHYNEKDNLKELQEIWARVDSEKKGTAKGKPLPRGQFFAVYSVFSLPRGERSRRGRICNPSRFYSSFFQDGTKLFFAPIQQVIHLLATALHHPGDLFVGKIFKIHQIQGLRHVLGKLCHSGVEGFFPLINGVLRLRGGLFPLQGKLLYGNVCDPLTAF